MELRPMTVEDWPAVAAVYAEGIAGGQATFESAVPTWDAWDAAHTPDHRLVATDLAGPAGPGGPAAAAGPATATADPVVLGWAACSPVSSRCVYAGVLEVSVYVAGAAQGRGVGSALLGALVTSTEAAGVWTLTAGIFPGNAASLALHARHGFRTVGVNERLGRTAAGEWRDVVRLERRSAVVGV
ncbi:GNAT family N-acetyltransferase [Actinotalea solisilvae]|uniref:GNAT family N-acetyltransferase n=1 Tax=Actinotalea solisilvae TaxID=2072922 RepID=UPI003FD73430